jgi:cell wall-associated NlpC family hydrolase
MASIPQTSSLTDHLRRATVVGLAAAVAAVGLPTVVAAPAAAAPAAHQAAKAHPTFAKGQRHPAVPYLKARVGLKNRNTMYGKAAAKRVARFEARKGLPRDGGRVTSATWRALGVGYDQRAAQRASRSQPRASAPSSGLGARVIAEARRHAGKPYAYGGNGPGAFDCSGFTRYVFAKQRVNLPRTAAQQRAATKRISRSQVRPGDLVFVHSGSYVSHVAIYAGGNMWWESSRPGKPVGKNHAWTTSVSYGRV